MSEFYPEKKGLVRAALLVCSLNRVEIAALTQLSVEVVSRCLTREPCFMRIPSIPGSGQSCLWRYEDRLDQHRMLPLKQKYRFKESAIRNTRLTPQPKREIKQDGVREARSSQRKSVRPSPKPPAVVEQKPITSSLGTGLKVQKIACLRRLLASNHIGEEDKDILHHVIKDYRGHA